VRLLREDGASFGKTKAGWSFVFKLHGVILDAILTPGHWAEGKRAACLSLAVDGASGSGIPTMEGH